MTKAKIESVAQTERAGLFAICFEGESYSEFEKFVLNHKDAYSKELGIIIAAVNRMTAYAPCRWNRADLGFTACV